ncbi:imelysin family protein [Sessilibacter corallicola]|uniref:Imelysin family protein n=1 Tax=Sessilibacter corallicola TaxID=2904075 RepID=A0ABQ0A401_9GAMM
MKNQILGISLAIMGTTATSAQAITERDVANSYADLAHVIYTDALWAAQQLKSSITNLLENPSEQTLADAKNAWVISRIPYQQSEAFRFSHPVVDEKDLQLNSWPLDEGFIDYVDDDYQGELGNTGATANIIAADSLKLGAKNYDLSKLTPSLLSELNEFGGSEANVATGYHAIEFLLWGQDLNGTESGAGNRPFTDFATGEQCTNGNCDRRRDYLVAATDLLISDVSYIVDQWQPDTSDNYRAELLALDEKEILTRMLFAMGSLAFGELAGERMKVALEANSPEDENDCFSDNTHNGYFDNAKSIANVYTGEYRKLDGTLFSTYSLAELIDQKNPQLAQQMQHQLSETQKAFQTMVDAAESSESPMKFDQMIAEGNDKGAQLINTAIESLAKETELIEQIAQSLDINNLNPSLAQE